MKKIYSFILASFILAGVNAQSHEISGFTPKNIQLPQGTTVSGVQATATADTIWDYLDRSTAYYILTAGSSGYVLGTSDVSTETGMHYDAIGNGLVNEILIYIVHKEIMGASDNVTANVYDVGADSMPTTLWGTGTAATSDLDTTGFPTSIALNTTGYSTNGFFVALEYGSIDDTVAILSNNPLSSGGGPDGAMEKRCRQNVPGLSGWARAYDVWTIGGDAFNADALIIPILDVMGVGVNPGVTAPGMVLKGTYPVPATNVVNIAYSLDKVQNVEVKVFDAKGMVVGNSGVLNKAAGDHEMVLNVTNFPAGKYYYSITTDYTKLTSKFVVVK